MNVSAKHLNVYRPSGTTLGVMTPEVLFKVRDSMIVYGHTNLR